MRSTSDVTVITIDNTVSFRAFRAEPTGMPKGAIIVVQEIFGLTHFVRQYARQWADAGYFVLAPALFDPVASAPDQTYGLELPYNDDGVARGRALRQELGWDRPIEMLAHTMRAAADAGPVSVVGFCWGGSLAFLTASRLNPVAAIAYYGGQIHDFCSAQPQCPIMMHFGVHDPLIPAAHRQHIGQAQPDAIIHEYDAGHGFACTDRADYHAASAALAWQRDQDFMASNMEFSGRGGVI